MKRNLSVGLALRSLLAGSVAACQLLGTVHAEILIGTTGSIKSPTSIATTTAAAAGFDTYIKRINESGGVGGQQIRVLFRDDEFKPELTVAAAKALIEQEGVIALVHPQATAGSLAMIKDGVLKRNNVAVVGPISGAPAVLGGENFFPMRISFDDEIATMLRHMKRVAHESVAYLYYNAGVGPAYLPVVTKLAAQANIPLVASAGFEVVPNDPAAQTAAIRAAVKKVLDAKPSAVFMFAVGGTVPEAIKELGVQGGKGFPRYTLGLNDWQSLIKNAGIDVAKGTIFSQATPYPYTGAKKVSGDYMRDLKKYAPNTKPSFVGLEGYMTARVLVEALRRTGPKPTSAKLLRTLETLGRYDLGDFAVEYSSTVKRVAFEPDITIINGLGELVR